MFHFLFLYHWLGLSSWLRSGIHRHYPKKWLHIAGHLQVSAIFWELIIYLMKNNISILELISDYDNCHFVYSWSNEFLHMFSSRCFVAWINSLVCIRWHHSQLLFWTNALNCFIFHDFTVGKQYFFFCIRNSAVCIQFFIVIIKKIYL